jgi:transposase-like protein
MELARTVYSRDLKIAAMRAIDGVESGNQVARRLQLSPKLLERWRGEWRARGEAAFPGQGHRQEGSLATDEGRIAELERKIGQLIYRTSVTSLMFNMIEARVAEKRALVALPGIEPGFED